MAKDPNKFQFNDKTGTGWKRDTNLESPTYGQWLRFYKWRKIEGSQKEFLNPIRSAAAAVNRLRIDQTERTQAKNKLMIDQGYVMNKRGRWTKPNPFTSSDLDNEELVNENIVEEEEKKLVIPPSPVDIAAVQKYVEKPEDDDYRKAQNFTSGKSINENDPYTQLSNVVSNLTGLKINQDNNNDQGDEKPKTSKDLKVNKSKGSIFGLSREEWQRATKNQRDRAKRLSNNNSRAPLIGGVGTRRYMAGFRD